MTTSEIAAQVLVRDYLDGRSMDAFMFAAAVWMAHKRLTSGQVPTLDRRLCDDIDSQAGAVRRIRIAPCITALSHTMGTDVTTPPAGLHASR